MLMATTISRMLAFWSANTIIWIFFNNNLILFNIQFSISHPQLSVSFVLVCPQRKSAKHYFTIEIAGTESP